MSLSRKQKDRILLLTLVETITLTYWLYSLLPFLQKSTTIVAAGISLFIFFLAQNLIFIMLRNGRNGRNGNNQTRNKTTETNEQRA